ncbi:DUF4442 domain-containing protein [Nocardia mangyaensis]|uniref:DUF4442 domain-containing protein n=1 Tax=Nocardia mangyaensis TaxID=2213200 RepID=UPI0019804513|nr:DUF4442 domain-containing protein [Nocardia mangyaensis]
MFTGAQVTALDADQALAGVPDNPDLRSHVNTVHAVALHLAADIACAVAFVGAATPGLGEVEWMVVRDSHSAFFKPAVGRIRAICDDNDVLVGKVSFQYVTKLAASQSAAV